MQDLVLSQTWQVFEHLGWTRRTRLGLGVGPPPVHHRVLLSGHRRFQLIWRSLRRSDPWTYFELRVMPIRLKPRTGSPLLPRFRSSIVRLALEKERQLMFDCCSAEIQKQPIKLSTIVRCLLFEVPLKSRRRRPCLLDVSMINKRRTKSRRNRAF